MRVCGFEMDGGVWRLRSVFLSPLAKTISVFLFIFQGLLTESLIRYSRYNKLFSVVTLTECCSEVELSELPSTKRHFGFLLAL